MEINLHNYEAYLLDHSEGSLAEDQIAALRAFALTHPELGINLGDLALPVLQPDERIPDFKQDLKRTGDHVPDELLLTYLERMLPPDEQQKFEQKLAEDAELRRDLALYERTLLQPDLTTGVENKSAFFKTEDDLILNTAALAYMEGQMDASAATDFERELQVNAALKQELDAYLTTRLTADASVICPDKEALKKEARVLYLFPLRTVASIAAALLLIAGISITFGIFYGTSEPTTMASAVKIKDKTVTVPPVKERSITSPDIISPVKTKVEQPAKEKTIKRRQQALPAKENGLSQLPMANRSATHSEQGTEAAPAPNVISMPAPIATIIPSVAEAVKDTLDTIQTNSDGLIHRDEIATIADDEYLQMPARKGFWHKAVALAKRANRLGVKTVDGEKKARNTYFLSFNSFSVEKR